MGIDLGQVVYCVATYLLILSIISFIAPIFLPTMAEVVLWIVGAAALNLMIQVGAGKYSFEFFGTELIAAAPWFVGDAIFFGLLGSIVRFFNGGQYSPEPHPEVYGSALDPSDPRHPVNGSDERYQPVHFGSGNS